ncbi:MAG: helix-hairpin-helix domain-containing protein [Lachnospiraceae bacterium]|nr:helix-hairpin-helix domain-containing protein [Lachnospiraceae bacterium]
MKNRILSAWACIITCVMLCALISGCGAKNSGLYRISVGEETVAETESDGEGTDAATGDADAADGNDGQTVTAYDGEGTSDTGDGTVNAGTCNTEDLTAETVTVYVHVCGAVRNPGVYELLNDDRVFTAIEAAGGFTEDASQDYVNLAEHVADGMKIMIPTEDELAAYESDAGTGTGMGAYVAIEYPGGASGAQESYAGAGTGASSGSGEADSSGLININTADENLLTSITGIGETRAKAIVAYRVEHGPFARIEDIKNVSGIGDSTYNKLKDEITVK